MDDNKTSSKKMALMHPSLIPYYDIAKKYHLNCSYYPEIEALNIIFGKFTYLFIKNSHPLNSDSLIWLSTPDNSTHTYFLKSEGIPTLPYISLGPDTNQQNFYTRLNKFRYPLCVRVSDRKGIIDVEYQLQDEKSVQQVLENYSKRNSIIGITEIYPGLAEYRILILQKKIVGLTQIHTFSIIGDGIKTIKALIKDFIPDYYLINKHLAAKGLTLSTVISANRCLHLFYHTSLSLSSIPHKNRSWLKLVNTVVPLELVEISLFCNNINEPFNDNEWFVDQLYSNPDLELFKHQKIEKKVIRTLIKKHFFSYLISRFTNGLNYLRNHG